MKENNRCKFNNVENTVVFKTKQILSENASILYVSHDEDDEEININEWTQHSKVFKYDVIEKVA